jgi:GAF domain-containing protein
VRPVFEAIAKRSKGLVDALSTTVFTLIDGSMYLQAFTPTNQEADTTLQTMFPAPLSSFSWEESIRNGEIFRVADTEREPSNLREIAQLRGFRSMLLVPLLRDQRPIGLISVTRVEPGPFSDHHVQLLKTFADQAVIAIKNVQLFDEVQTKTRDLEESLKQQTATSEVLEVVSSSPGDLDPVFNKMLESATRVCGAQFGTMTLYEDNHFRTVALYQVPEKYISHIQPSWRPHPKSGLGTLARTLRTVQIEDLRAQSPYLEGDPAAVALVDLAKARTIVLSPMLKDGHLIGALSIFNQEVRPFTPRQVELLENFAKQAVVAVENARLLKELRQRTNDLGESLQQQTATAEVLDVISRSAFDLQAVFATVVQNSVKLCDADRAIIFRYDGELLRIAAAFNTAPEFMEWIEKNPIPLGRHSGAARAALEQRTIHIPDVLADPEYVYGAKNVEAIRTILGVPILKGDNLLGVIMIFRLEVNPFAEKQIALVETFADQAAIAIENTRLFDEVQARTEDLQESLQQQTATADVLKVISRSTFDLPTVLQTLVESAARLCDAEKATITRQKDGVFVRAEAYGFSDEFMDYARNVPVVPDRGSATGRALLEGVVVHIPDVRADLDYTFTEGQRLGDFRTILSVPMMREGIPIGIIVLTRSAVRPFNAKQIEVATTFADQAAIAIENVRLFDEVQARTRELSRSLDDLRTAQDRLVQTEKLASLGQLTAGIAHEIKNPLNFVNNFAALSVELTDELKGVLKPAVLDQSIRAEVDEITGLLKDNLGKVVQHGKRADSIVKNMLLHSREGSGERRSADINALVGESLNLAYHGARAEKPGFAITLKHDLDPNAGALDLYPQEITRALLNLISNGFYAATRRKVDAGVDTFEPVLSATTKDLGQTVEIRIRDNGTGISPEVRVKMFNPFFTTKPTGEGTGLGLSMTHDIIVKQHGGRIDVDTEPGAYTEFIITLPRDNRTVASKE